ncbi:MAG: lipoprotein insertase outer membrane protein LolB [Thiomonas sp.]|nr:lipoprotein insertase outer membrane protein LolB [Thiomonas sp.]
MRRRVLAWGVASLAVVALGGCATPRISQTREAVDTLAVAGRLSLVSGPPDAQKALYGGFRLELRGAASGEFEVFSPLGQMQARAQWSPGQASLNDGRQTQTYASFDAMTRAALGVALPQAALQDWVRGRPAAGLPAQRQADGGFEQLGWLVQPTWRDGKLVLLTAQRLGGDPAQLRMVIESATPQAERAAAAGAN